MPDKPSNAPTSAPGPLPSESKPSLSGGPQDETKKPGAVPEENKAQGGGLQPAGETSDPLVHQALAELETAERNRDALDVPEEDKKAADEAVKAAKAKLKDLGVAV